MTTTAPETNLATQTGDGERRRLWHCYCVCSLHITLCGIRRRAVQYENDPPEEDRCLVCEDLCPKPCPRCGLEGA